MRQAEAENYWLNSSNYWLVARIKKKVWPHPVLGAEPNLMKNCCEESYMRVPSF